MRLCCFVIAVAALVLAGCGGGGGGSTPPAPKTTAVSFSIDWAARSRAIEGPASALSATLTLPSGGATVGDFVATVDRDANLAAHTQAYTTTNLAKTGTYAMAIRFYDQPGGLGGVVGVGKASVTIVENGSGIGSVTVDKAVTQVTVDDGGSFVRGEVRQLTFTSKDNEGHIVAVSPGSAHWTVVGGNALTVTDDGIATGVELGNSGVRVDVDGAVSPIRDFAVASPPSFLNPGFEEPALNQNQWIEPPTPAFQWGGTGNRGVANGNGSWGAGGHSGNQYGFVQQDASLQQTIALVVGKTYRISAWIARRNGNVGGNIGEDVQIELGGTVILAASSPNTDGTWKQVISEPFTATVRDNQVTIRGLGSAARDTSSLIDDVGIELMP